MEFYDFSKSPLYYLYKKETFEKMPEEVKITCFQYMLEEVYGGLRESFIKNKINLTNYDILNTMLKDKDVNKFVQREYSPEKTNLKSLARVLQENFPISSEVFESQNKPTMPLVMERLVNAIEGLKEIRDAEHDIENWHYEFNKSFENVGGLGVRPKPNYNFSEMYAKYPRAAAYIKADEYRNASNYRKSAIGQNALNKIVNGEDYVLVIENMEREWSEYCVEHIFD